jgi:hypothetical protein
VGRDRGGRDLLPVHAAAGGPEEAGAIFSIGVATFLGCVAILSVGRRIERTLEILNWILVTAILSGFLIIAALLVPGRVWLSGFSGLVGYDLPRGHFDFLPGGWTSCCWPLSSRTRVRAA